MIGWLLGRLRPGPKGLRNDLVEAFKQDTKRAEREKKVQERLAERLAELKAQGKDALSRKAERHGRKDRCEQDSVSSL